MTRPRTAAPAVRRLQNQEQALKLRLRGKAYRQIGAALGVSASTAYGYVADSLAATRDRTHETTLQFRALELARLDAVWDRAWGDDDTPLTPHEVMALVSISIRRARLLGLDAPVKRELSGPGGGPIPLALEAPRWDLGKLTTEQLLDLERLQVLAAAQPVAIQDPDPECPHATPDDVAPRALPAGHGMLEPDRPDNPGESDGTLDRDGDGDRWK